MIDNIKHIIKVLIGRKDYWWYQRHFEGSINKETWTNRNKILSWANECVLNKDKYESESQFISSDDPVVRQGYELRKKILNDFKNKLSGKIYERILIQVPDWKVSPAGYSLFSNMIESLNYIGVPSTALKWGEKIDKYLEDFKPTIFLTGDNKVYTDTIDWNLLKEYKKKNDFRIGLTASLQEYGNTPLSGRLDWAKDNGIDFYFSFRDEDYFNTRNEYKPFFERGYKIYSVPFGANPLIHYPLPNIKKDTDYIFIASVNKTKAHRYLKYMGKITRKYLGFIDGPGWQNTKDFTFNRDRDRYIYARSKIGLNIHLEEQIDWACETSERTYQLAACGIPQVTDHAKIFDKIFSKDTLFIADTPREYKKLFKYIIENPDKITERVLRSQREVFEKYTTFHRAEKFVTMLSNNK